MDLYWTLVFLHVIAFAYWLGGDFGVYVTGGYVARADLPLAERLRFLHAFFEVDILPRTGEPDGMPMNWREPGFAMGGLGQK